MYLILAILLLVTPVYCWEAVSTNPPVSKDFDMETTSLEIMSDSVAGSDNQLKLRFYRASTAVANGIAGGFEIRYYPSEIKYRISFCQSSALSEFENVTLPSAKVKVWRITLTRQTDAVSMKVYCNDELVLDTVVSDANCPGNSGATWTMYWNSGPITRIRFEDRDRASDYYQAALSCDAGNYRVTGDPYNNVADSCKQCGENTFSGKGAFACTKCPPDTTSPAGSTSVNDCKKGEAEEDCTKTFTCSGAVTISVSAALAAAAFLATILI